MISFSRRFLAVAAASQVDPFRVLGLPRSASREEVKRRYREMAKKYHPDSGSSANPKLMEDVNRAYNTLIKENGYEQLAVKAAPRQPFQGGSKSGPSPSADEKEKWATLDPMTERMTPDNKFMYKCRVTNEWRTLDRPLTRPEAPRYAGFQKERRDADLFEELQKRSKLAEQELRNRPRINTKGEGRPFDSTPLLVCAAVVWLSGMYVAYDRNFVLLAKATMKVHYYGDIREHRERIGELHDLFHDEVDCCAAAAAMLLLAASQYKAPTDPEVPRTPSDLDPRPPWRFFRLANIY